MSPKIYKLVDDPCFGEQHKLIDECEKCWIHKACAIRFRNRKE